MQKERKSFTQLMAEAQFKTDFHTELKALKNHPQSNLIGTRVIGNKEMLKLASRGWRILSHAPSNYAHAANIYVMIIDRPDLESYLTEAKRHGHAA